MAKYGREASFHTLIISEQYYS